MQKVPQVFTEEFNFPAAKGPVYRFAPTSQGTWCYHAYYFWLQLDEFDDGTRVEPFLACT